jgi:hypothetical protein
MSTADDASRRADGPHIAAPSDSRSPRGATSSTTFRAEPDIGVRPYYLTRGRTRTDRPLGVEVLVQTTARGHELHDRLLFEQHAIASVCASPVSVAEVAARVQVPLGVARVLIADMAAASLVEIHDTPARVEDDVSLIQRLIHGVREL